MSRIAVVGARGFLGAALCARLTARGTDVLPLSSATGDFDARTGVLLPPADSRLHAVVYVSQSPFYRDAAHHAAHLWAVNVQSAVVAAEWARRCGATRLVYASSGTVYRPAFEPHHEGEPLRRDPGYGLSKVHAEEALSLFADTLDVTRARFFSVYGPGQRGKLIPGLIDAIGALRPVHLQPHPSDPGDTGGVKLSMLHVDDAADALVHLLDTAGPSAINIAAPEALSIRQIADAIAAEVGTPARFETTASPREADAVADTTLLNGRWPHGYVDFTTGIARTISWTRRSC